MTRRFWRRAFQLLYTRFAFTYDLVSQAVSLGHWRAWQRCALPQLPPPHKGLVLELAHGAGDSQLDLLKAGYKSVALDLSPQMGRLAKRKLARNGMRGALLRGSAMDLPLPDESVAAVICAFPTAFIFQLETLSELERVMQPGARAIVVVAGELDGIGPLRFAIRLLYRLTGQGGSLADKKSLHLHFGESGFLVDTHVVRLAGSRAQMLILTKPPAPTLAFPPTAG